MITLFTIPKAFAGLAAIHQRNAIQSWKALPCRTQIILVGSEPGAAEICHELGCKHAPDVRVSDFGTPCLRDAFELAGKSAEHPLLCYCNADIMLFSDFVDGVARGTGRPCLIVGRRYELDVPEVIEPVSETALSALRCRAVEANALTSVYGIDYFVYRPGTIEPIPPFYVGRPWWDNWMIGNALHRGMRVVDATGSITAVHQKHGYGHVPDRTGPMWQGPEAEHNKRLLGNMPRASTLNATHRLARGRVIRNIEPSALRKRVEWLAYCLYQYRPQVGATVRLRYVVARHLLPAYERIGGRTLGWAVHVLAGAPRVNPDV